ncbi:MAG: ribbon-helix-helix domain-containing protein [Candidatus Bathyarchaeia archaeon]
MPGRRYSRLERKVQVFASVPVGLLNQLDDLIEKGTFRSRSAAIAQAVEALVSKTARREALKRG